MKYVDSLEDKNGLQMGYLSVFVEKLQRFLSCGKSIDFDKKLVYHILIQAMDLLTLRASYTGNEVDIINGYLIWREDIGQGYL